MVAPSMAPKRSEKALGGADSSSLFPVVGIGASAGGLPALTELLRALPHETGAAIVIVQHLDPSIGLTLEMSVERLTYVLRQFQSR